MEFFTNPWFILLTASNILVTIYFGIKWYHKPEKRFSFLKKLQENGIFPTLRKPFFKPLKEEETKEDNKTNNT